MRIVVTGANGQLGMTFQAIAPKHPGHEFFFCSSKTTQKPKKSQYQIEIPKRGRLFFRPFSHRLAGLVSQTARAEVEV